MRSPYRRLLGYVRPHGGVLLSAFFCMFMTALFEASPLTMLIPLIDRIMADKLIQLPNYENTPVFLTDLVDHINAMPRLEILSFIILLGLAMVILRSVFEYGYTYLMNDVSYRVIRDMRSEIYGKLVHLPLSFFGGSRAGNLVSRVTYDTGMIRDAISEGLKDVLFQPIELIFYLVLLLVVRSVFEIPWSFIFVIALVLPLVIYPIIRLGKKLKKISRISQEQMSEINSSLFESIGGIRVVQAFGMEDYEKDKFYRFNSGYHRSMMSAVARNQLMRPLTLLVITLCACAIAWMGGRQIVHHGMSAGALTAFLGALFSLFRPFKRLSRLHAINQIVLAAAERIFLVLDTPQTIQEPENPVYLAGLRNEIEFRQVHFAYEPEKEVLRGINLKIRTGEVVALVGPSGAGKSTLANLLLRFYDPIKGQVLIDGHDLRHASLRSLRNQIGIVTQDPVLFNDTISANIAYGKSGSSNAEIEAAAKAAHAHAFITRLPQGYQTVVGDRGFKLSGGEKQRLTIARAIFKNSPILILDEATSALDSESERLVQEASQHLMKGRTVLVIAHRLSTIKKANRIVVLENGQVSEQGIHEELLQRSGLYRKIYELQFQA